MLKYPVTWLFLIFNFLIITHQQIQDAEFKEKYNKFKSECAKEQGLDEDYVMKVWKENHFPNDPKLKCYFKCMDLKFGIINESGDVVDDVLKAYSLHFHDASTDAEIVTECGGIQGADLCETAFKLMTCIKNATLD